MASTAVTPMSSSLALPSLTSFRFLIMLKYHATSNPVSGLAIRLIVYSKSLAVSGTPSDHWRPFRRWNVQVRPSLDTSHFSAARGLMSELMSCITKASVIRPGCHWLFWTVLLQSMNVPSRPISVRTCFAGGAASAGSRTPTELSAAVAGKGEEIRRPSTVPTTASISTRARRPQGACAFIRLFPSCAKRCLDPGYSYWRTVWGSSASRSPSPSKANPAIVSAIMIAGKRARCQ